MRISLKFQQAAVQEEWPEPLDGSREIDRMCSGLKGIIPGAYERTVTTRRVCPALNDGRRSAYCIALAQITDAYNVVAV